MAGAARCCALLSLLALLVQAGVQAQSGTTSSATITPRTSGRGPTSSKLVPTTQQAAKAQTSSIASTDFSITSNLSTSGTPNSSPKSATEGNHTDGLPNGLAAINGSLGKPSVENSTKNPATSPVTLKAVTAFPASNATGVSGTSGNSTKSSQGSNTGGSHDGLVTILGNTGKSMAGNSTQRPVKVGANSSTVAALSSPTVASVSGAPHTTPKSTQGGGLLDGIIAILGNIGKSLAGNSTQRPVKVGVNSSTAAALSSSTVASVSGAPHTTPKSTQGGGLLDGLINIFGNLLKPTAGKSTQKPASISNSATSVPVTQKTSPAVGGNMFENILNILNGLTKGNGSTSVPLAIPSEMMKIMIKNILSSLLKASPLGNTFGRLLQNLGNLTSSNQASDKQLDTLVTALTQALQGKGLSWTSMLQGLMGNASLEDLSSTTLRSLLPTLSANCTADIGLFVEQLLQGQYWALSMFDASGKIQRSILKGNTQDFVGNYDECREIDTDVSRPGASPRHIKGAYYVFVVGIPASWLPTGDQINLGQGPLSLSFHVCLPASCDIGTLFYTFANKTIFNTPAVIKNVVPKEPAKFTSDDTPAVVTLSFLAFFIFMVVLGTTYDVILVLRRRKCKDCQGKTEAKAMQEARAEEAFVNKAYKVEEEDVETVTITAIHTVNGDLKQNGNIFSSNGHITSGTEETEEHDGKNGLTVITHDVDHTEESGVQQGKAKRRSNPCLSVLHGVLLAFSLRINTSKLFNVKHSSGSLTALQGIRVLSMAWVVLGHTLSFDSPKSENAVDLYKLTKNFLMQTMLNGTYSVDSFFLMSGFLVAFLFLKETKKQGGKVTVKQMAYFYFHRYWRLTPAMMGALMVYGYLFKYLGDGPMWTDVGDHDTCRTTWWRNLLYVQNLFPLEETCYGVAWYLANDMQFYIISPLILVPMAYGLFWVGYCLCLALLLVALISSGIIIHRTDASIFKSNLVWMEDYYFKPYNRVGVYAIGLALGALLHQKNCKARLQRVTVTLGWLLAMAVMVLVTTITFDTNKEGGQPWSAEVNALFQSVSRPAWGLMLSWIIFACVTGHGGVINSILSWAGWLPFARLSYGVYLLHLVVMDVAVLSGRVLPYFSVVNMIYRSIGFIFASFFCSYLLNILVESPCIALEKVLLGKKSGH